MNQDALIPPSVDAPRIETPEAAHALCGGLTATITDLVATLDRETGLLRKGRPQDMAALYARKSALTITLMKQMAAFGRDSQYIAMAAPERVEEIKANQEAFQKSLAFNQDALNAMKSVSESLLRTIADYASQAKSGPQVYGAHAGMRGAKPSRPAAISFDKTL